MGHRKLHAPRHGSLGVRPRKRAEEMTPRVRTWPSKTWAELALEKHGKEAEKRGLSSKPTLLGFAAYKAGMTHALIVEDKPHTPLPGRRFSHPSRYSMPRPSLSLVYVLTVSGSKAASSRWARPGGALLKPLRRLTSNTTAAIHC